MTAECARCGAEIPNGAERYYVKVQRVVPIEMGDEYGTWSGRKARMAFSATVCDRCGDLVSGAVENAVEGW